MEKLESTVDRAIDLEAAIALARIEDVESWADAISFYFETVQVQTISLQTLQQAIELTVD
jgi:hypothetical protein